MHFIFLMYVLPCSLLTELLSSPAYSSFQQRLLLQFWFSNCCNCNITFISCQHFYCSTKLDDLYNKLQSILLTLSPRSVSDPLHYIRLHYYITANAYIDINDTNWRAHTCIFIHTHVLYTYTRTHTPACVSINVTEPSSLTIKRWSWLWWVHLHNCDVQNQSIRMLLTFHCYW